MRAVEIYLIAVLALLVVGLIFSIINRLTRRLDMKGLTNPSGEAGLVVRPKNERR